MGLGGTAKKLQKITDAAEKLYAKMNEIIGELKELQAEVEDTSEQVDHLERDVAEQRALLEAIAGEEGIDVEAVLADADLPPLPDEEADGDTTAESADGETDTASTEGDDGTDVPVSEED